MKSILIALLLLAFCRVSHPAELAWSSWTEAKMASRVDGKPIVVLLASDSCPPCRRMKTEVMPAVYRRGALNTVHVAIVDVDRDRQLFDKLRLPSSASIPQLVITDLHRSRVLVGFREVEPVIRWLQGDAK